MNWISLIGWFLGLLILALAVNEWISPTRSMPLWSGLFAGTFSFLASWMYGAKERKNMEDERTNVNYTKSSRNALFATYLVFAIHFVITNTVGVDAMWVTIILGSGIVVFLASLIFYHFRKS